MKRNFKTPFNIPLYPFNPLHPREFFPRNLKFMLHEELTGKILQACFEVSKELGSGFLESVYEKSLMVALKQKGLQVVAQVPLSVKFRGVVVGEFYADILVEEKF